MDTVSGKVGTDIYGETDVYVGNPRAVSLRGLLGLVGRMEERVRRGRRGVIYNEGPIM